MDFNFDGRRFRACENSATGEVSQATLFDYHQDGNVVWGSYAGGGIRYGQLVALMGENGELDMRYHHVNLAGELMTGVCHSVPTRLANGRYRVEETWQWTSGDRSAGRSVLEEVAD
jgi:hypothetical protein